WSFMAAFYYIYPHNDLWNIAFHHLTTALEKDALGDRVGITLDCQSSVLFMALAVEATINFVGHRVVKNWNERKPYHIKLKKVCSVAQLELERDANLVAALKNLKLIRDTMAHGKPVYGSVKDTVEASEQMDSFWGADIDVQYSIQMYECVRPFCQSLIEQSGADCDGQFSGYCGRPRK
ncbi:TPA: hypothetical protein NJ013_004467, partial [Vibrio parahaemolyticus]|nr:hypothetical protein [Vibrio parahaemolyticus]HCG5950736.1 hypothetical protein [Vibrio parahaemolyticus]HCG8321409.1 hypothetical protein [Vibrio parahaemolyticus]